ncbi:MAG: DNA-directed RNA polymerase subunit G [Desulfurococcales archaeon]|nr:DNA-directed RNA polymerase subunit G [Desulfurococcales archaeon]
MELELEGEVVEVNPGRLRGQRIAKLRSSDGGEVVFDVIEDLLSLDKGERVKIIITDEKPSEQALKSYDFCGHGYLVESEDITGKTVFSLWGILFLFNRKLGLKLNKKYYLCIQKST